ncbi:MAG: acyl transferase [Bacteroidota bacterium]|jgi:hypothetical protein
MIENPDFTLWKKIFQSKVSDFDELAMLSHTFQLTHNRVYAEYYHQVKNKLVTPYAFLPVEFFKTHKVYSSPSPEQLFFESSSTTSTVPSRHFIASTQLYERSYTEAFHLFYGNPEQYTIFALLPSYLERDHSSLVYMVNGLIKQTRNSLSGFYLNNFDVLAANLKLATRQNRKILLLGVTYALLDFADACPMNLSKHIIMETGGMKGRGPELTRAEVHKRLRSAFQTEHIHSEYGMTELLSQAYSTSQGRFNYPPWMRIVLTDVNDPFAVLPLGKSGRINCIDLANYYSCSFIQTDDLGTTHSDGTFEVLGRLDNSDTRGCNLLYV